MNYIVQKKILTLFTCYHIRSLWRLAEVLNLILLIHQWKSSILLLPRLQCNSKISTHQMIKDMALSLTFFAFIGVQCKCSYVWCYSHSNLIHHKHQVLLNFLNQKEKERKFVCCFASFVLEHTIEPLLSYTLGS
jgi:hypothetical protein